MKLGALPVAVAMSCFSCTVVDGPTWNDDGFIGTDEAGEGGEGSSDTGGVTTTITATASGGSSSSEDNGSSDSSTSDGETATTPCFRSDCSLENCGFPQFWGQYEGVLYDTSYVPGGCPDGSDSVRIEYRPGDFDPGMVQHPLGFGMQGICYEPTQGMELYIRWRARVINQFPGGQNNLGWGGKFIMIGDPGPENSRLIANLRDDGTTAESTAYDFSRNIDGAEHGTGLHGVPVGEWVDGQLYVRTSTTAESEDAQLKMWLDEDNASEDTPTGESPSTFAIDVSYWAGNNIRFGGFVGIDTPIWTPAPIIEMCGFEIDDEFDPNWDLP